MAELKRFGESSHDKNPLHISETYARKSPFGSQVVYGVLGGITCLRHLQERPNHHLVSLKLDFSGAIYVDIPYKLEIHESTEKAIARIYDGRNLLLKLVAQFQTGHHRPTVIDRGSVSLTESLSFTLADLQLGQPIEGLYRPASGLIDDLFRELELKGIDDLQITTLLWSSYLIGMELPGERALFSKLSLQFTPQQSQPSAPLSYQGKVTDIDDRFNLVQIQAKLAVDTVAVAIAKLSAFVRNDSPVNTPQSIEAMLPRSTILKNQVALVIGGSRGLGAAIVHSLALQGCTVLINYYKSQRDAELLQQSLADAPGEIVLMQGDASDLTWCESAKSQILRDYGKLDFLVCNACPPILPLWIESNAIHRVNDYVSKSLALMSVPMATFLDVLSKFSGCNVAISSVFSTQTPPSDLPHYVSAKHAIEGLMRVAAVEYSNVSNLLVRPPKLLTDQTNTPMGRQGAIASEVVAVKLIQSLIDNIANPGQIEILEQW